MAESLALGSEDHESLAEACEVLWKSGTPDYHKIYVRKGDQLVPVGE